MRSFDTIDYQLIALLEENARSSIKQLAEKVFMSPPAVAGRLTRLERDGIIKGYQPLFDINALGYNILAFVNLQVSPADKVQFLPYIASVSNVLECHSVTGDYTMLMKVCFHNMSELDMFIGELHRFGRTHTQVVFSTPVEGRGPSIPADLIRAPKEK